MDGRDAERLLEQVVHVHLRQVTHLDDRPWLKDLAHVVGEVPVHVLHKLEELLNLKGVWAGGGGVLVSYSLLTETGCYDVVVIITEQNDDS